MSVFTQKLALGLLPSAAAGALKLLGMSYRFREINSSEYSPLRNPKAHYLFAFWHGQILPVVEHFRHERICAMASRNKDGEIIARSLVKLGYPEPARGSSSRGGASALKDLAYQVGRGYCAVVTPDGPRGPRQVAQAGIVQLAKMTGRPIIPLGFAGRPVARLKSWDGFQIPMPFARGTFYFEAPVAVPPDCDQARMEELRRQVEEAINRATRLAEESLQ